MVNGLCTAMHDGAYLVCAQRCFKCLSGLRTVVLQVLILFVRSGASSAYLVCAQQCLKVLIWFAHSSA